VLDPIVISAQAGDPFALGGPMDFRLREGR